MLRINAYLVSQAYSGPQEGGCYHDIGTPLASIPVPAKWAPGQSFRFEGEGKELSIIIETCPFCNGTGEQTEEEHGTVYQVRCDSCNYIPSDPELTCGIARSLMGVFENTPGRYERLRVSLEREFPEAYSTYQPYG